MEHWSILSNVLNYVQHNRFHSMKHTLDIKVVNKYKHKPNTDNREFKELDFGTKCQLLLDMGASKSFMSKSFYMQCKSLHSY